MDHHSLSACRGFQTIYQTSYYLVNDALALNTFYCITLISECYACFVGLSKPPLIPLCKISLLIDLSQSAEEYHTFMAGILFGLTSLANPSSPWLYYILHGITFTILFVHLPFASTLLWLLISCFVRCLCHFSLCPQIVTCFGQLTLAYFGAVELFIICFTYHYFLRPVDFWHNYLWT